MIWVIKVYASTFLILLIIDKTQASVFQKYMKNFIDVE